MLLSVLMSIYDKDNPIFLEEAFESIYAQSRPAEELVIVFDGPLNESLIKVVECYREKFISMGVAFNTVPLHKNVGLGLALAEGSKHCKGKYIVRMDSDDISIASRFERLVAFLKLNSNVDVFGAQIEEFHGQIGDLGSQRQVPLNKKEISSYAKSRNPMNHVTVCIKREALEDVGGYEGVLWHEDYYLWLKMISKNKEMANMPDVQVYVRVKGDRKSVV